MWVLRENNEKLERIKKEDVIKKKDIDSAIDIREH